MNTKIYHSNFSQYKEYTNEKGIKTAVARLMKERPEAMNVLDVIEGEDKKSFLKYNPWLNTERKDYGGDIELVTPYKDGYMILRHFAIKPRYNF